MTDGSERPGGGAWSAADPGPRATGGEIGSTQEVPEPAVTEPDASPADADGKPDSVSSFLRELPVLIGIALVLAFLLRTFAVQVFFIPSGSMEPTLMINDRMIVEKISYRFGGPERGQIIVFEGEGGATFGTEPSGIQKVIRGVGQFVGLVPADARDFVKRVIGLPGDEVVIVDGIVSVNGVELDEPYAALDSFDGTYRVPEGRLFVLGDNRRNSSDSRFTLGFIPIDDVVGRAVLRIWPLSEFGTLPTGHYADIPDAPPADAD